MAETSRKKARWKMGATAKAMEGAHYLNGAKGARPGAADGARVRPSSVKLEMVTNLQTLAFFTATWTETKEVENKSTGKKIWVASDRQVCGGMYEVLGGHLVVDTDMILKDYLAQQNPKNPALCWTKGGYSPRRLAGKRDTKNTGRIVWGENCDGRRHFDCIGLVEFAVDQVVKQTLGGEIWQFASPNNVLSAKPVDDDTDIMDGDLVSRVKDGNNYHHIGVIYKEGGVAMVAQAVQTSVGVTVGTVYNKTDWNGGRWRLPNSLLKEDGEVSDTIPNNIIKPIFPALVKD